MLYNLRGILLLVLTTVVLQPFSVGAVNLKLFCLSWKWRNVPVELTS
jgi:hypothetical protein